ncbi:MAG: quinone-interacting membrane-bound oxidoreductase complex subunit QmoC [Deltaproteobacteria bacterium]|nr:quinone-interacting membrane-bound oxidoreductase complex subunit QmoC [Deltaproteobacteria bacterium]
MPERASLSSSAQHRRNLRQRGGEAAARCFQCATCSSVCELAPPGEPFPRRQMLAAQWGLADRLAADPALWLCHQCNDCSARCPRDAKPGEVMQVLRGLAVEELAVPRFLARLAGRAEVSWPLLLGLPIVLWAVLVAATGGLPHVASPLVYGLVVPHWLIYAVFFPLSFLVLGASYASGRRFWALLGQDRARRGSFLRHLVPVLWEILVHRRFARCDRAAGRRLPHLALFWGFAGAALTSGLIVVAMYGWGAELPLHQSHPFKILGNVSAALLVGGGLVLVYNRLTDGAGTGTAQPFDRFFLALVVLVATTGVLVEIGRFAFTPELAVACYVGHLGVVVCLFATFPYSKFSHVLYRTLAMVHERMTAAVQPDETISLNEELP